MSYGPFDLRGIPLALHLNGPVDVPALLGACAAVGRLHPVLGRVRVTRTETTPERYPGLAEAEAARPFDLDRGPLARFTLVTVGPGRVRLLFVAHPAVFDAASKDVLLRELADVYFSQAAPPCAAVPSRRPAPSRADVPSGTDASGDAEAFWAERDREPAEPVLPGLRAVPDGTGPGEIVEMVLGAAESGALTEAAATLGATRFELLLAALGALLRHYGTAASPLALDLGTRTPRTRERIGPFTARVPFVPHPGPEEEFPAHVRAVRAELRAMYRFRHAPPEPSRAPVLLSYRRRAEVPEFAGVAAGVEWTVFNGTSRGALHVQAVDAGRSLTLGLRFNPAAIDREDVSGIAGDLRALLRAVPAAPRSRIADLTRTSAPVAESVPG
ncbi:condensation domain-containing protein [Streptosporangium longisporum]|uniref:Condensation domain-containing protein n=1 Tax=Streptosporangium longisporum TaxID=46187 RepID=A0ABP6LCV0_9ACTN